MQDFLDVSNFHRKFELPMGYVPKPMTKDAWLFRHGFLQEELQEFKDACEHNQFVHAVDALLDLNYVVFGTALFIGTPTVGRLGKWLSFQDIVVEGVGIGMAFPDRPSFMHEHLQVCFEQQMQNDIAGFERAHIAAEFGARNAIELALLYLHSLSRTVYAAAAMMGVPWRPCWTLVHLANMKKVRAKADGSNSTRRTPWDVVKPEGWAAPDVDIAHVLVGAGFSLLPGTNLNAVTGKVTYTKEL